MAEGREPSPTVRRWRLAKGLREARELRRIPAAKVAGDLGWGSTKPLYLENRHAARPKPEDVAKLCDYYGLSAEERAELVQLAVDSRIQGWWEPYKRSLSPDYTTFIGLEAEASHVLSFQPLVLPGLLQTDAYSRALVSEGRDQLGAKEIGARVAARTERRKLLTAETDPLHLHAIVDEAAIRRVVGSTEVMRAQLEHLRKLADLPNVVLRIVPFAAGAHAGVSGSFAVLRFRDERDPTLAYIETIAGQLFVEKRLEVGEYEDAFDRLTKKALRPEDTMAVIIAAAATV
jgi:hypothetical protein